MLKLQVCVRVFCSMTSIYIVGTSHFCPLQNFTHLVKFCPWFCESQVFLSENCCFLFILVEYHVEMCSVCGIRNLNCYYGYLSCTCVVLIYCLPAIVLQEFSFVFERSYQKQGRETDNVHSQQLICGRRALSQNNTRTSSKIMPRLWLLCREVSTLRRLKMYQLYREVYIQDTIIILEILSIDQWLFLLIIWRVLYLSFDFNVFIWINGFIFEEFIQTFWEGGCMGARWHINQKMAACEGVVSPKILVGSSKDSRGTNASVPLPR